MDYLKYSDQRAIILSINVEYFHKARVKIIAESNINDLNENGLITTNLFDSNQKLVCKVITKWDLSLEFR